MHILRLMAWSALYPGRDPCRSRPCRPSQMRRALCASPQVTHARSCSDDVDRMQARIDARVEAIAAAGPFVPPGISAGPGVQPTPFGGATVEERMGELTRSKFDAVHDAMTRARAANAADIDRIAAALAIFVSI
jgi:hypothetical protein